MRPNRIGLSDKQRSRILYSTIISLIVGVVSLARERDTTLTVKDGNPPTFVMSGSGSLGSFRVRGPKKQREAEGEDASVYWLIKANGSYGLPVEDLSPITYGRVPKGYIQVYPEKGTAPPLIEGERYFLQALTIDANGAAIHFTIRDGRVVQEDDR